ncbi:Putative AC transposase-like protein [Cladobotryum mycophilum]|uniref:AC transposase-like protein n=1 Tax=Cladobotryum mycophilum TaxID=491253 RepID=A0ABR0SVR0_9HYPO
MDLTSSPQLQTDDSSGFSKESSLPPLLQTNNEAWKDFPWIKFPGYTKTTRSGVLTSWIWRYGFDIELQMNPKQKKWVCQRCIKKWEPISFNACGIANAEHHLREAHSLDDPTGKRKRKRREESPFLPVKQRTIDMIFNLNAHLPRDQAIINALKTNFVKEAFQQCLVNWIVDANLPFRTLEHPRLRQAFKYTNPLVKDSNTMINHTTIRNRLIAEFNSNKDVIKQTLRKSPGLIHIAFDGWRSRNQHTLFGITCCYLDPAFHLQKLVLGLPELRDSHTGANIANEIANILDEYDINDKIGYFSLDNASNNDTAMASLATKYEWTDKGSDRRIRCFGHILNLAVKAFLFGNDSDKFNDDIPESEVFEEEAHTLWLKTGPVGKLHNLVTWIRRSDSLTQSFLKLQEEWNDKHPANRRKVLHLIQDNATRWLSQYYMIERALLRREVIEDLWDEQSKLWKRSKKKNIPFCLRPESQLTDDDWKILEKMRLILEDFERVLKEMEGDGQQRQRRDGSITALGVIWEVLPAFEFLLATLEKAKTDSFHLPFENRWRISVNSAWVVLDKYYRRLDETPVYYAAVSLHPKYRFKYFEEWWSPNTQWISSAKNIVKNLWENQYKYQLLGDAAMTLCIRQPKKTRTLFDCYRTANPLLLSQLDADEDDAPEDEFDRWLLDTHPNDSKVSDPFEYWMLKQEEYPHLSRMAIDILSVPPMSAEPERLFSVSGAMVAPRRSRLEASTIGIAMTLRSWLRAGLIKESIIEREEVAIGEGNGDSENEAV